MDTNERHVFLCSGCANETGAATDANVVAPDERPDGAGCEHCGAILVGFVYRVPESTYSGMAPGAG